MPNPDGTGMIPTFNAHGVLPPFAGSPTEPEGLSPYLTTIEMVVSRFAPTPQRREILSGFLQFRCALRDVGIVEGTQWLDGSFMENKEEPGDIDVVTFFRMDPEKLYTILDSIPELFSPLTTKERYRVDAYFVNLAAEDPFEVVREITYYYGLFSHQRGTVRWKGMLQVPLTSPDNDTAAHSILSMRSR